MVRTMSIDTEKNLNEIHANQMTDMREVICSAVKEFESEVLSRGPFSQVFVFFFYNQVSESKF